MSNEETLKNINVHSKKLLLTEFSIIKLKLFPFFSKESLKKEKFLFLNEINKKLYKSVIDEEKKFSQPLIDKNIIDIHYPRNLISLKEIREIMTTKLPSNLMSIYYSMKEIPTKVPLSFKVNNKNNYMNFKDTGGDKQNYYKFSSKLFYNLTDDLGVFKKFFRK